MEVGATWGSDWTIRGYTGFRASEYRNQGTFDPSDPLRRDKTLNLGATWTLRSSFLAQIGVEGVMNRSNSSRPEYNALRVQAVVSVPLPQESQPEFLRRPDGQELSDGVGGSPSWYRGRKPTTRRWSTSRPAGPCS